MGDLAGLIERLEKLAGPDREVDVYLHALAVGGRIHSVSDGETIIERPIDGFWIRNVLPIKSRKIAAYTASLDAAIALTERVLAGWFWRAGRTSLFPKGWAYVSRTHPSHCDRKDEASSYDSKVASPAIALLLATLRALSAQERDDAR